LGLARPTLGTLDTRGHWLRVGLGVARLIIGTVRLFDTRGQWLRVERFGVATLTRHVGEKLVGHQGAVAAG